MMVSAASEHIIPGRTGGNERENERGEQGWGKRERCRKGEGMRKGECRRTKER